MELVRVPTLTQEVPYAYAAIAPGGTVYAAGACPLDEAGDVVTPGDVAAQAERVMRNLEQALHAAQCGLDDVLKTTVYVASSDRVDLVAAWNVVRAAFDDHERAEHVNRFHEMKAQYLAGEPRVEFFSLHVGKGVPEPHAQRP